MVHQKTATEMKVASVSSAAGVNKEKGETQTDMTMYDCVIIYLPTYMTLPLWHQLQPSLYISQQVPQNNQQAIMTLAVSVYVIIIHTLTHIKWFAVQYV